MKVALALFVLLPFLGACGLQFEPRFLEAYLRHPHRSLTDYVRLLEGKSDRERRKALEEILRAKGIDFRVEPYRTAAGEGANIIFELGTGGTELIISAHYDAVPGSPGANDDASCISSILAAYGRLKRERLGHLKVRFVIFDDEESGLKGSKAYVRTHALNDVIAMYSLELCGIGDTVAVWELKKKDRRKPGIQTLIQTFKAMRTNYVVESKIPRYGSDHKTFAKEGIPAVAVTIIPKRDEAVLREYIFQPNLPKWAHRENRPSIFQTYHTPNDKAATLEEGAMKLMAEVISEAVLGLNRRLQLLATPWIGMKAGRISQGNFQEGFLGIPFALISGVARRGSQTLSFSLRWFSTGRGVWAERVADPKLKHPRYTALANGWTHDWTSIPATPCGEALVRNAGYARSISADVSAGESPLGGSPSRITFAIASSRVWERLRCARRTPRASASSLATPENRSVGGPFS